MSRKRRVGAPELPRVESDFAGATAPCRNARRLPPFHVVLLNDDEHTDAYVLEMLEELFGYPITRSYRLVEELDAQGRVVLLTTHKEHAELKRDQVLAYGPDRRIQECSGSMSARIEPAPQ